MLWLACPSVSGRFTYAYILVQALLDEIISIMYIIHSYNMQFILRKYAFITVKYKFEFP